MKTLLTNEQIARITEAYLRNEEFDTETLKSIIPGFEEFVIEDPMYTEGDDSKFDDLQYYGASNRIEFEGPDEEEIDVQVTGQCFIACEDMNDDNWDAMSEPTWTIEII
ncbi:MAG: hypothetical protein WCP35_15575 [Verrucomicrobiota bacterium]